MFDTKYGELVTLLSDKFVAFRTAYFPDEQNAYVAAEDWLQTAIADPTGLPASVRAALVNADKDIATAEATRAIEGGHARRFAARRFPMPPGAAAGATLQIQQKAQDIVAGVEPQDAAAVHRAAALRRRRRWSAPDRHGRGRSKYITALASGPNIASGLANVGYDAQSKLISAASSFYGARSEAAKVVSQTNQFNATATQDAASKEPAVRTHHHRTSSGASGRGRCARQMATSLFNNACQFWQQLQRLCIRSSHGFQHHEEPISARNSGLRMATNGIVDQMNNFGESVPTPIAPQARYGGTAAEASTLQERAGILSGLQTAAPARPAPAAPAPAVATQPVAKPLRSHGNRPVSRKGNRSTWFETSIHAASSAESRKQPVGCRQQHGSDAKGRSRAGGWSIRAEWRSTRSKGRVMAAVSTTMSMSIFTARTSRSRRVSASQCFRQACLLKQSKTSSNRRLVNRVQPHEKMGLRQGAMRGVRRLCRRLRQCHRQGGEQIQDTSSSRDPESADGKSGCRCSTLRSTS